MRRDDASVIDPANREDDRPLRRGWSTGACAAAAARAATQALLGGGFPESVEIELPRGLRSVFELAETAMPGASARVAVRKDAGDDPDVTHGALIVAEVCRAAPGVGIVFRAGEGVGMVTRPGLPIPVGEPSITPAPRQYISQAVSSIAEAAGVPVDFEITLSVPGGKRLAEKTMNARLGVIGGLSILGTTGVVIPYSCGAWIASIHRGVDVARAAALPHIAATTGRTSEAGTRALYGLSEQALIEMGDFAGGLLKYVRTHPVPRLTIGGGFAKIAKLAAGHLDLHSRRSAIDINVLATQLGDLGAAPETVAKAAAVESGGALLEIARQAGLPIADRVAHDACAVVRQTLGSAMISSTGVVDVVVFDRAGRLIGRAGA